MLFRAKKPVNLKTEKRNLVAGDVIELTAKRADEIQKAVDAIDPNYGELFERIDEPKQQSKKDEPAAEKTESQKEGTTEAAKK